MLKKLVPILLFNVLVGICFVIANVNVWNNLNWEPTVNTWDALQIATVPVHVEQGRLVAALTFFPQPNYPFILFWISSVGNVCFFVLTLRNMEKKQSLS